MICLGIKRSHYLFQRNAQWILLIAFGDVQVQKGLQIRRLQDRGRKTHNLIWRFAKLQSGLCSLNLLCLTSRPSPSTNVLRTLNLVILQHLLYRKVRQCLFQAFQASLRCRRAEVVKSSSKRKSSRAARPDANYERRRRGTHIWALSAHSQKQTHIHTLAERHKAAAVRTHS